MSDAWEYKLDMKDAIVVEEASLRSLLTSLQNRFPDITFEAEFDDAVRRTVADVHRFFQEIAIQDRKLSKIEVHGIAREMPHGHPILGKVHLAIRDGTFYPTLYVSISHSENTFFELKDQIERFASGLRAWYSPLSATGPGRGALAHLFLFGIITIALLFLTLNVAKFFVGAPPLRAWLDSVGNSGSTTYSFFGFLLVVCVLAHLCTTKVSDFSERLFPRVVFLLGTGKSSYERIREVRKIALGVIVTVVVSVALFVLGLG